MSEIITACENVCQDFSWLKEARPFLIPLIPVSLGIIIFWRQKSRERYSRLQEIRGGLYREFVDQAFRVFSRLSDSAATTRKAQTAGNGSIQFDNCEADFRNLQGAYDAIATCAPRVTLKALDEYLHGIAAYRSHLRFEFGELKFIRKYKDRVDSRTAFGIASAARNVAVEAIRKEILQDPFRSFEKDLTNFEEYLKAGGESLTSEEESK